MGLPNLLPTHGNVEPWHRHILGDGYGCKESNLFFLMIEVVPPPRMPVANEGLGWDPYEKCKNPGGV